MHMSNRQLRRMAALAFPILAFSGQSTVSVMPVAMQDIHKGETLSSVNIASTDAPGPGADGQTVSTPEEVAAYAARGAAKYSELPLPRHARCSMSSSVSVDQWIRSGHDTLPQ